MVVEMKNGRLTAGGRTLFDGLSFRAEAGEVHYVDTLPVEAHTPLVHALMGLRALDEGFVSIDGEVVTELSAPWMRRFMAYVPRRLRWPDEERFRGRTDEDIHGLLMENAAAGDSAIVFVEGLHGADDEDLCRRMAQRGRTVVVCREPASTKAVELNYEVREGEIFNQEMI